LRKLYSLTVFQTCVAAPGPRSILAGIPGVLVDQADQNQTVTFPFGPFTVSVNSLRVPVERRVKNSSDVHLDTDCLLTRRF
jgi:hypothetical protein